MKFTIPITDRARSLVAAMTTESLLNQIACPQCFTHNPLPDQTDFGALFFHPSTREKLRAAIAEFKARCSFPPLITTDMENGPGDMITDGTRFPSLMAAGIVGDEKLAWEMGRAAALEGREAGFNWSLSPCVDIAAIMDSPMVSLRAAGRDPDTVIRIASAFMRGMQENGMIATIKHFPGDGYDIYDQHLTVSCNPQSKEQWMATSGRVFRALIDDGAVAVMPGHISLPAFDGPWEDTGFFPPASISKRLLTDLLRGELGFDGLIVSDAVNMGGFAGFMNRFDATVKFLEAGGDCVLFPHLDYFHTEMKKRLDSGMLARELLVARAERIVSLKDKLGLLDGNLEPPTDIDRSRHESAARTLIDRCVRVVRDRNRILPFPIEKSTRVAHLVISMKPDAEKELHAAMAAALAARSDHVTSLDVTWPEPIFDRVYAGEFDLIVCSICARHDYGTNVARLSGPPARLMMTGWMKLGTPTVFVNHFHPFVEQEYLFSTDTLINTFGSTPYTMERVVRGITGEQPFFSK